MQIRVLAGESAFVRGGVVYPTSSERTSIYQPERGAAPPSSASFEKPPELWERLWFIAQPLEIFDGLFETNIMYRRP